MNCVAKFPLKSFYDTGKVALTQVDWTRYFMEVAEDAETTGLKKLHKVCKDFLEKAQRDPV